VEILLGAHSVAARGSNPKEVDRKLISRVS